MALVDKKENDKITEEHQKRLKRKKLEELETVLDKAIARIQGKKDSDLCRYIPSAKGEALHHFTLRKMIAEAPDAVEEMVEKFILKANPPQMLAPRTRTRRASRLLKDHPIFNKVQLDKLWEMANRSGDPEIVEILKPKRSLSKVKHDLIQSIRRGIIEQPLWEAFVECVRSQQTS